MWWRGVDRHRWNQPDRQSRGGARLRGLADPAHPGATTLGQKLAGAPVNLEVDLIGKYVEKLVGGFAGGFPAGSTSIS